MTVYNIYKTKWGGGAVLFRDQKLVGLLFPEKNRSYLEAQIYERFGEVTFSKDVGNELCNKLSNYFKGQKADFLDIKIDLDWATDLEKQIYQNLRKVPAGITVSYRELAIMCGKPNGARAVGNAMAKNRIPVVIPCHRVLKSDGSLGGWSGKTRWKEMLLKIEGVK
ncbi:MAG: Methylated-DNA-protein-cysteine methyltransferase, selenocysteine-containing [candidate division CPR2 bacterium GW2011_GWC1_41_48]|uniref:methylated-DNA--[protein]-cysteine S-methyltransferase n=1 Tax=candidate division CPR2 bacterium GW2011_GWC1_41_48 TaxID=1618344 RepID=A0A0G0W819_UNCC2|nr:MAG: Methylated-DNA-protein-cysteine methyltransferase, selenocysteine-containing [candidate division CPR2 bacterium GW2011_GWC2_39_35]KKR28600.1 MAG: Methylated-DNA-protein-cysteine methyltransferase, selenocysteine-containing [candidate division CPR2 bacterium GW2011_GWD1_39_7]KKR29231.1 MAG: Methylated-DNA-protein-cysteine methyltransferase, selenocysteine-containing [candidate division CPR2 bacterium GW2011_GWD2_39_7]KKS09125.1 MAG: Methylated-DNA-protein-cysteine methyltransferase, selen